MKYCPRCSRTLPLNAFYNRRGTQTHSYCKKCVNEQTMERQRRLKQLCIEYKGGKCQKCEGIFHPAVFDFHHINPEEKEFSIAKRRSLAFNDEITKELDKCLLLCANCHRLEHTKY